MSQHKLNSAGRLTDLFATSKLTILFMLACTLLGLLAVTLTPREENPQIIVPGAEVRVFLPGASAAEVEQLVVRPLEDIIKQIPGVDHTFATAMNSVGVLSVQFKVGQNKEKSLVKLYDRILGQRDRLPADASTPLILSVDVDDVPIVTVTLASQTYDDYALKRLADRLLDGFAVGDALRRVHAGSRSAQTCRASSPTGSHGAAAANCTACRSSSSASRSRRWKSSSVIKPAALSRVVSEVSGPRLRHSSTSALSR
jgi:hypothetical protein